MLWLKANIGTILIIAVLVIIVALIIRGLIKDKKAGKGTCGGDCSHCHASCMHSEATPKSK